MADMSRKAIVQVESFVSRLLEGKLGNERSRAVAKLLATGTWTHDHALQREELQRRARRRRAARSAAEAWARPGGRYDQAPAR